MSPSNCLRRAIFTASAAGLLFTGAATSQPPRPSPSPSQPPSRERPKLEPVAETKLLMEGLMQANFRGLERNLKQRPVDDTAWVYARGQALLIAETGNLLLIRPPKSGGQDAWQELSTDLREKATRLRDWLGLRISTGPASHSPTSPFLATAATRRSARRRESCRSPTGSDRLFSSPGGLH